MLKYIIFLWILILKLIFFIFCLTLICIFILSIIIILYSFNILIKVIFTFLISSKDIKFYIYLKFIKILILKFPSYIETYNS